MASCAHTAVVISLLIVANYSRIVSLETTPTTENESVSRKPAMFKGPCVSEEKGIRKVGVESIEPLVKARCTTNLVSPDEADSNDIGQKRLVNKITTQPSFEPKSSRFSTSLIKSNSENGSWEKIGINEIIEIVLCVMVMQTMLGLGCAIDFNTMKDQLRQPKGTFIAAACHFGITPLIAFLASLAFRLDQISALAVIVTGSCPGGNLSNILTYYLYGDMNLSVFMSAISVLLSLVFMPLCLLIYGSSWVEISINGSINSFEATLLTLSITLLPLILGIAIKTRYEDRAPTVMKVLVCCVITEFPVLLGLSFFLLGNSVFTGISAATYLVAIFQPLVGYIFGYLLGSAFRLPDATRRTVAIGTGCQNSQLSAAILKIAFPSETIGAYFLFPFYYLIFQGLEGLGLVLAFRAYRRYYADDEMVPLSRVTYDEFDSDSYDGEDMRRVPPERALEGVSQVASLQEAEKGENKEEETPNEENNQTSLLYDTDQPLAKSNYGGLQ